MPMVCTHIQLWRKYTFSRSARQVYLNEKPGAGSEKVPKTKKEAQKDVYAQTHAAIDQLKAENGLPQEYEISSLQIFLEEKLKDLQQAEEVLKKSFDEAQERVKALEYDETRELLSSSHLNPDEKRHVEAYTKAVKVKERAEYVYTQAKEERENCEKDLRKIQKRTEV